MSPTIIAQTDPRSTISVATIKLSIMDIFSERTLIHTDLPRRKTVAFMIKY